MFHGRLITLSLWLAVSVLSNLMCLTAQLDENPEQKGLLKLLNKIEENQKNGASNPENGDNFAGTDISNGPKNNTTCTSKNCLNKRKYAKFQCATGETNIPTSFLCDGTAHCADGSDENIATCRIKYPTHCVLPTYGNKISIKNSKNPIKTSAGDLVEQYTSLSASFNTNYGDIQLICINGEWISAIAGKNQKCNGLPAAGSNVKYLRYQNGREVNSHCTHFAGMVIYPICEDQETGGKRFPNVKEATCGEDGKWSVDSFHCYGVTEKCHGLPKADYDVALYYKDGSKANPKNIHSAGTVIYPKCKPGSYTYPNLREARCNENGKWSVDRLECYTCSYSDDPKDSTFPLVEVASSSPKAICDVQFVSPYLILTAASCFNKSSTSDYYVYLARQEKMGDSVNSPEFVKIKKIHYRNSQDKKTDHVALAEVDGRLTLDYYRSFVCLDWPNYFVYDLQPGDEGLVTTTTIEKHPRLELQSYSWTACNGSNKTTKGTLTKYEGCVDLDNKKYEMKKGAGFYLPHDGINYLRAIAINATQTPTYRAILIGTSQFWEWILYTINTTNRDYPYINASIRQIKN